MTNTDELLSAWQNIIYFGFQAPNLSQFLALCDKDFSLIGTGLDEYAVDAQAALDLTRRDFEQSPEALQVDCYHQKAQWITEDVGVVQTQCTLHGMLDGDLFLAENLRMSAVLHRQADGWRLVQLHTSFPDQEQRAGEAFPMRLLAERNRRLRRELEKQSGVLHSVREELESALHRIRDLTQLVTVCSKCRQMEDGHGHWMHWEELLEQNSGTIFTHGLCPTCLKELYPTTYNRLYANGASGD